MTLGERIRELRKTCGLSQEQLADRLAEDNRRRRRQTLLVVVGALFLASGTVLAGVLWALDAMRVHQDYLLSMRWENGRTPRQIS